MSVQEKALQETVALQEIKLKPVSKSETIKAKDDTREVEFLTLQLRKSSITPSTWEEIKMEEVDLLHHEFEIEPQAEKVRAQCYLH